MNVELRCFGPVREAVGTKSATRELPEGATVADLLSELVEDAPDLDGQLLDETGEVSGSINVTVDGDNVRQLDGAATALSDGDVVRIAPPVVGGGGRQRRERGS
ncbi:ubiquitin-like small modifier protein 1 [Salinirubellus sp. GCM10025818]|jgi:molybdopterin synthase sulfur carrier subunit|uniref:ubiquitin-like small modifier protein 1 n=1 Tax=Salinirubellus TaxID=2162630 RepID=UPI0030D1295F